MWRIRKELFEMEPPVHSIYIAEPLWAPDHTLMHRQSGEMVKIYTADQNPMFFRKMLNWPLPMILDRKMTFCTQLIDDLYSGKMRPEVITLEHF